MIRTLGALVVGLESFKKLHLVELNSQKQVLPYTEDHEANDEINQRRHPYNLLNHFLRNRLRVVIVLRVKRLLRKCQNAANGDDRDGNTVDLPAESLFQD